jgi:GDP-L-fucose synthase
VAFDFTEACVLVTGGGGFVGSFVSEELSRRGATDVVAPRSSEVDLTDARATRELFERVRPSAVVHLAARVGGIGANRATPGTFFRDNMLMGVHVLEEARRVAVEKIVLVGTTCSYPKLAPLPFCEDDLWNGYPEETNAAYGVAKRALLTMGDAYRREFGMRIVALLPANLYGPRDNFDLATGHVIPAMIRKLDEARRGGRSEVVLWGDGTPTREFLFVADVAEAVVTALERYEGEVPLNIGTGVETSMLELAELVAREVGFGGRIGWDATQPNGQPRRRLDVERAKVELGFEAKTGLAGGLRSTYRWWQEIFAPTCRDDGGER